MNQIHKQPAPAVKVNYQFANPRLAAIAESFQVRKGKGWWYSLGIEILAVVSFVLGFLMLTTCIGSIPLIPLALLQKYLEMYGIKAEILFGLFIIGAMLCAYYFSYVIATKFFFILRRHAKSQRADALAQLSRRTEDPVLYLRSFADDLKSNPDSRSQKTYGEDLALALNKIGPVIAIGNPSEQTPSLGATRIYLKHEQWQENVRRLMQISRLIVIQAGTSFGVIWELEKSIESVSPRKVVMSFLSWLHLDEEEREHEYDVFKKHVEAFMNHTPSPVMLRLPPTIGSAAFLVFDDNWTPEPIEISRWQKILYRFSSFLLISETIRPALSQRGLELSRMRKLPYFLFIFWLVSSSLMFIPAVVLVSYLGVSEWVIYVTTLILSGPFLILTWLVPNILIFIYHKFISLFRGSKRGNYKTG